METKVDNKLEVKEIRKLSNQLLVQVNNSSNHNHILFEKHGKTQLIYTYVHGSKNVLIAS